MKDILEADWGFSDEYSMCSDSYHFYEILFQINHLE